ncbi:MAG TPA: cysteine desulfurase [Fimbriimonas sp.]|nr:cysteine desulfurase [Fimbriimonas sp.]
MPVSSARSLDWSAVRSQFPAVDIEVRGRRVAYLDNAATSQKPLPVLDAMERFWREQNANVHRGVHYLSQVATSEYEAAREAVQRFLNAPTLQEIVFTKGCTESINLVANGLSSSGGKSGTRGSSNAWIGEGDEILVSTMEHHSNIVPWQIAAEKTGASVKPIPVTDECQIDLDTYSKLLQSGRVKVVGIVHVSNAIGTVNPVKEMTRLAHEAGALVLIDGAQSAPHLLIDVQDLDADFYVLSGHKLYGPTGIGVLYGRKTLLEQMPAYQSGGDMIRTVSFSKGTTYADLPAKFEAGTPSIAGAIGLGKAIDYLENLGNNSSPSHLRHSLKSTFDQIEHQEADLERYGAARLSEIPGLKLYGPRNGKAAILSFTLESAHAHDVGTILDMDGVAVRTGHHCCMPLMERLGVAATTRASLSFYNTRDEIDRLVVSVRKVQEMFSR